MRSRMLMVSVLLSVSTGLAAQGDPPRRPRPPDDGRGAAAPNGPPLDRQQLEQQVRQRLGQRMREDLGLNEAQMGKLTETNRRFQEKHYDRSCQ